MKISLAVRENFKIYAAEVIQKRALINVLDGLKPSARQIFYALYTDKINHTKKPIKTHKCIASAMRFYVYGDSSALGIIMRAGQPFNTRYPLADLTGAYGDLTKSGNWSAARYTSTRLSHIADYMFKDIEKDTIDLWYDNFDDTEQFPSVLPCRGFYPLVQGSMGIGVALASSVPAFNLIEMNTALIDLLWDRDFELPMPDFPGGGILVNRDEVEKSLLKGNGNSAVMRSKIVYNKKKSTLTATEIPPLTYTGKICEQLATLAEEQPSLGIKRVSDMTGDFSEIVIQIEKGVDPDVVTAVLYKETDLQNYYGINMTMLDGSSPKVFSLPAAMKKHLEHEIECYKKGFLFDVKKIEARIHILEGLIKACQNIEEVVQTIKTSKNRSSAHSALMTKFDLTSLQSDAILKMTLSRIASMEVQKFNNELTEKNKERERLLEIVENENLLKKEVEKGLQEVMDKFGDKRRTQIINIGEEEKTRFLYFTKTGKAYLNPPKLEPAITSLIAGQEYMAITKKGIAIKSNDIPKRAKQVFKIDKDDEVVDVLPYKETDFLIIYNNTKNFRCLAIKSMNKGRTTLSLQGIEEAVVVPKKITKAEYLKIRKK